MTTFGKFVSIIVLIGIGTTGYFFLNKKDKDSALPSTTKQYINDTYNFTIDYPNTLTTTTFQSFHNLSTTWRTFAQEGEQGIPIVSIPIYRIDQEIGRAHV